MGSSVAPTSFNKPPHEYRQFARVFGVNRDIDGGSLPEDIWSFGGTVTFPDVQDLVQLVSDNAADTAAGAGGQTVLLDGVDDKFNRIQEVVPLAGLTPTNSKTRFLWVNQAQLHEAGLPTRQNQGTITGTIGGLNAFQIEPGIGRSLQAIYTIPKPEVSGTRPYALVVEANIGKQANVFADVEVFTQEQINGVNSGPVLSGGVVYLESNGTSLANIPFLTSQPLNVGLRIWFRVIDVSANNVAAAGSFQIGWQ